MLSPRNLATAASALSVVAAFISAAGAAVQPVRRIAGVTVIGTIATAAGLPPLALLPAAARRCRLPARAGACEVLAAALCVGNSQLGIQQAVDVVVGRLHSIQRAYVRASRQGRQEVAVSVHLDVPQASQRCADHARADPNS